MDTLHGSNHTWSESGTRRTRLLISRSWAEYGVKIAAKSASSDRSGEREPRSPFNALQQTAWISWVAGRSSV